MTQPKIGPGVEIIDGERYATETFEYQGERYTVRELSADESDDIADAATGPGPEFKFNARLNSRMLLAKALVYPQKSIDEIGRMPGPKYLTILRYFNKMNTLPEANPTLPAGSAGQTSPDTGESSPQT